MKKFVEQVKRELSEDKKLQQDIVELKYNWSELKKIVSARMRFIRGGFLI